MSKKYSYAEAVQKRLEEDSWVFEVSKRDEYTFFSLRIRYKACPPIDVTLIMSRNDLQFCCCVAEDVKKSKFYKIREKLNEFNDGHQFVRWMLDGDERDLWAFYDLLLWGDEDAMAEQIIRMLKLFAKITAQGVPQLMHLIESEKGNDEIIGIRKLFEDEGGDE